ncbi:hypothetical protein ABT150_17555 [Streptomyces mirabilis]|uniref:hypothetical protein n=1 Tax=Streptomyces mirabilis TaxID=68239 RepID=UPI00332CF6F5
MGVGLADEAGDLHQARLTQQLGDTLGWEAVDVEVQVMAVRGTRIWCNSPRNKGSSSNGVCAVEYQTRAPASDASSMSRSAIVPTSH